MMLRLTFLKIILLLSIGTIILFPLFIVFYEQPAFIALHRENISDEAVRFATHLSSVIITGQEELRRESFPASLITQLKSLEKDPHFLKIKIFSPSGEVLYSTDPKEIGTANQYPYFHEIVAQAKRRTQEVSRHTASLERKTVPADVVETYVPIVRQDEVIGVFEIYYNISAEKEKLQNLVAQSSGTLYILALLLLGAVLLSTSKANRNILARELAETEREKVIVELKRALGEIKKLSGLLPICFSCKKIRDDKGYWSQIESYISEHSEAQFTHGICPECAEKILAGTPKRREEAKESKKEAEK
jgi:hypothetical protein